MTSWGPDIVTVQAGFVPEHDPSDFGYGDLSVRGVPAVGQRPLLTILVDYKDSRFDAGSANAARHDRALLPRPVV